MSSVDDKFLRDDQFRGTINKGMENHLVNGSRMAAKEVGL